MIAGITRLPLPLGIVFSSLFAVHLVLLPALWSSRLSIDDSGLTLSRGGRSLWTIPWTELLEARHEPGSIFSRNWDRLVLRTASGTKTITFNDRLSGRWEHHDRIRTLLRARGYSL